MEAPAAVSIHRILRGGSSLTETQPEFDETKPNGGNPDIENVNAQYQGLEFHYIYLMIMAYLVWLIIPGIGLLYSGLSRRKSALAMLFQSFAVMGVYVCPCSSSDLY
jgi:hypothetical protein